MSRTAIWYIRLRKGIEKAKKYCLNMQLTPPRASGPELIQTFSDLKIACKLQKKRKEELSVLGQQQKQLRDFK